MGDVSNYPVTWVEKLKIKIKNTHLTIPYLSPPGSCRSKVFLSFFQKFIPQGSACGDICPPMTVTASQDLQPCCQFVKFHSLQCEQKSFKKKKLPCHSKTKKKHSKTQKDLNNFHQLILTHSKIIIPLFPPVIRNKALAAAVTPSCKRNSTPRAEVF